MVELEEGRIEEEAGRSSVGSKRWDYVSTADCGRPVLEGGRARLRRQPVFRALVPGRSRQAIALSMICASWVLLTAPICVACTLPSRKIIRVGIPRTL